MMVRLSMTILLFSVQVLHLCVSFEQPARNTVNGVRGPRQEVNLQSASVMSKMEVKKSVEKDRKRSEYSDELLGRDMPQPLRRVQAKSTEDQPSARSSSGKMDYSPGARLNRPKVQSQQPVRRDAESDAPSARSSLVAAADQHSARSSSGKTDYSFGARNRGKSESPQPFKRDIISDMPSVARLSFSAATVQSSPSTPSSSRKVDYSPGARLNRGRAESPQSVRRDAESDALAMSSRSSVSSASDQPSTPSSSGKVDYSYGARLNRGRAESPQPVRRDTESDALQTSSSDQPSTPSSSGKVDYSYGARLNRGRAESPQPVRRDTESDAPVVSARSSLIAAADQTSTSAKSSGGKVDYSFGARLNRSKGESQQPVRRDAESDALQTSSSDQPSTPSSSGKVDYSYGARLNRAKTESPQPIRRVTEPDLSSVSPVLSSASDQPSPSARSSSGKVDYSYGARLNRGRTESPQSVRRDTKSDAPAVSARSSLVAAAVDVSRPADSPSESNTMTPRIASVAPKPPKVGPLEWFKTLVSQLTGTSTSARTSKASPTIMSQPRYVPGPYGLSSRVPKSSSVAKISKTSSAKPNKPSSPAPAKKAEVTVVTPPRVAAKSTAKEPSKSVSDKPRVPLVKPVTAKPALQARLAASHKRGEYYFGSRSKKSRVVSTSVPRSLMSVTYWPRKMTNACRYVVEFIMA